MEEGGRMGRRVKEGWDNLVMRQPRCDVVVWVWVWEWEAQALRVPFLVGGLDQWAHAAAVNLP